MCCAPGTGKGSGSPASCSHCWHRRFSAFWVAWPCNKENIPESTQGGKVCARQGTRRPGPVLTGTGVVSLLTPAPSCQLLSDLGTPCQAPNALCVVPALVLERGSYPEPQTLWDMVGAREPCQAVLGHLDSEILPLPTVLLYVPLEGLDGPVSHRELDSTVTDWYWQQ